MVDVVTSLNGMTGEVVLDSSNVPSTRYSSKVIEDSLNGGYRAEFTQIEGDDYLMTIIKKE